MSQGSWETTGEMVLCDELPLFPVKVPHLPSDVVPLPLEELDSAALAASPLLKAPQLNPIFAQEKAEHEGSPWLCIKCLIRSISQLQEHNAA